MVEEGAEQEMENGSEISDPSSPETLADLKPKMLVKGKVIRLELYGAFIDIGVGVNAILHISKLPGRVNRVSDLLNVGDEIEVWILTVDSEKEQITVTMQEPVAVDWSDLKIGQVYTGKITRLERFGAFVDIGAEKEGLVHISELSHDFIKHPSEVIKVDQAVDVQVLGFSKRKRRIDLSRKALMESPQMAVEEVEEEIEEEEEEMPTAMEIALRRAMSSPATEDVPVETSKKSGSSAGKSRTTQDDILSKTLELGQQADNQS